MNKQQFSNKKKKVFPDEAVEKHSSFWFYLSDLYGSPEIVELYIPAVGRKGRSQDAKRIRGYFEKSLEAF